MKIDVRIKQSEIRVRSGIKLVFFIAVTASVAWVMDVLWLAKILIFFVLFFFVVTLFEYWNAWRLKRKL
ncbi:hypothetical protein RAB70_14780 [Xanthomonas sontii]|uniref:hypothetical protein n=1 Tax=Xanthomonas sontii TaxID=2650745 RepID=UPI0011E64911|nr:hypothetical protein [Xanthomonas sontii]MDQ7761754.1 hypothetical protein [Xanthomonas sontii]UZK07316.1 hypothetical protein CJ027_011525 [Xanthomonas sontii]